MTSIIWTYLWALISLVSLVVRSVVLRHNLRDRRLINNVVANASPLMKRIVNSHLRMSVLLATVSFMFSVVGLDAILLRYHPHWLPMWVQATVGYAFIITILAQSCILTILAWFDLRMRGAGDQ